MKLFSPRSSSAIVIALLLNNSLIDSCNSIMLT